MMIQPQRPMSFAQDGGVKALRRCALAADLAGRSGL